MDIDKVKVNGNTLTSTRAVQGKATRFSFDGVYDEKSTSEEIYEAHIKRLTDAACQGLNGTVFAYGQTGAGKTHTIRGDEATPGIMPQAISDLFDIIKRNPDTQFLMRVSYVEIYNEEVRDLLSPSTVELKLREVTKGCFQAAGLIEPVVTLEAE
eukprot:gene7919-9406_t